MWKVNLDQIFNSKRIENVLLCSNIKYKRKLRKGRNKAYADVVPKILEVAFEM